MRMTTHFDARMNQRGIRKDLVDLALDLGDFEGDRCVLPPKMIDAEIVDLQHRMKLLTDARRKGGLVVVTEGEALITTYRKSTFSSKLSKNKQPLTLV